MPSKALRSMASTSTALAGFFSAPAEVAWVTDLITLRTLSSVSSRPCSAFSVASATALRSFSPCLAEASANMSMRASWSMPDLIMGSLLEVEFGRHAAARFWTLSSGKWQAATWPGASSRSTGASVLHCAWARGQRGWKWQPVGGWIGLGTSPSQHDALALPPSGRGSAPPTAAPRCRDAWARCTDRATARSRRCARGTSPPRGG